MRSIPLVGQKVFDGGEQEGAESPASPIGISQIVLFEQQREKSLRQILRLVLIETISSDEGVDGWPIRLTQGGQRLVRVRSRKVGRGLNESPVSGLESKCWHTDYDIGHAVYH